MKKFVINVGQGLLTAALIANVTLLWNFNARLVAIETKLGVINTARNPNPQTARNP